MIQKNRNYAAFEKIVWKNIQITLQMLFPPRMERLPSSSNIDKILVNIIWIIVENDHFYPKFA